jgi:hypothetical protein
MKTVFTLIAFITSSLFAVAREKYPDVKVTTTGEYLVVVDGKHYENQKQVFIKDMQKGIHYIDVFRKKKGLFGSKYKLVSSKQFEIEKKDMEIEVNASGYIKIGKDDSWDGDQWYKNRDKSKEKNKN